MAELFAPAWALPQHVAALASTRRGGVSAAPWHSLNLGDHVGDDPRAVAENRRRLCAQLPAEPLWLRQVHGAKVVLAETSVAGVEADAAISRTPGVVCAVLHADCLPVLLCDRGGRVVAAAHAGWRGLAAGVLEATVAAMDVPGGELLAWIGPAISAAAFEVGSEVRAAFVAHDPAASAAFSACGAGKFHCDLPLLATQRLQRAGVCRTTKSFFCTVHDDARFFSHRRDKTSGRMVSCIWLRDRG